jgi:hypothetical protein
MLRNYLLTTLRNLAHNKVLTITLSGQGDAGNKGKFGGRLRQSSYCGCGRSSQREARTINREYESRSTLFLRSSLCRFYAVTS